MISFAEPLQLDCPRCGTPFQAETWIVIDGQERPDLVARILDGSLHNVECPNCGQGGAVPAPLLYHNGLAGRVLLAVPPGMDEAEWREVGQSLLWTLIGALPEEERLPYLGDLQAEQGLAGIAQVIEREQLTDTTGQADDELPPIVLAIQALLAAQSPSELQQVRRAHAILNEVQAVAILRELAHAAFQQGEEGAGSAFSRAADILVELNALYKQQAAAVSSRTQLPTSNPQAPFVFQEDPLDELAFAVMRTQGAEDLAQVVDEHPELLEDGSDALLEQWAMEARLTGKPRIADGMDERRQALAAMRAEYQRHQPVLVAVQLLLDAETPEAVEAVIIEHGELLTDEADMLLQRLMTDADDEVLALIGERRALLQQVRRLLEVDE